ncbi:MAG: hypothetical protein ABIP97_03590 [Chthoniobacterales bacterium]
MALDPGTGAQTSTTVTTSGFIDRKAWDADAHYFYFASKDRLFRFDHETGALTTKSIPLLGEGANRLIELHGKLYAATPKGSIISIDPSTMEAVLLASAKRRPAQTPLDDRAEFSVENIFPGEGGLIFILNEPWYYVLDEITGNFRKSAQPIEPLRTRSYDRQFVLNWIGRDGDEMPQVYQPVYMLLTDPGRTGTFPGRNSWPPALKLHGDEEFDSSIFDEASAGLRLAVFYSGGKARAPYLYIADEKQNFSVPLKLPLTSKIQIYDRISANETGILVYGRTAPDVFFYSFADLQKFPR